MTQRPNILLVVVDCARSDKWIGPNRHTHTPVIDRLAAQSAVLPTTITEKSCTTPSFSTLLTGQYSPRHGVHLVWGYRLPESVPMLTEAFARIGYHTYAEASGPLLPEMGLARGFEHYAYRAPCDHLHTAWGDQFVEKLRTGGYRAPWLIMLHIWELHPHRLVQPEFDNPNSGRDEYERAISSLDAQLERVFAAAGDDSVIVFTGDHGEKTRFEEYRPDTAVDYARKLLRVDEAEGMAPFQIAGWAGPSVLQQLYGRCAPGLRDVNLRTPAARPRYTRWARLRDRLRLLRLTPMVFLTDLLSLGAPLKLTRMLERRGLLDPNRSRRKVERFADALGEQRLREMHLRMWINSYKHNYEEGHMVHVYDFLVRVPLLIRWPGRLRAGVFDRMVRQPDIVPTLLDLLGVEDDALADIEGRSLRPLLDGEAWAPAPAFLSVSGCPRDIELHGVRTETHKFTFGPHNDELPVELYDLRSDPGETRNVAAEHADVCAELRALAERFAQADGAGAIDAMELSADDQQRVERHLQELGYLPEQ
ncbi:MAG: hypothetical protein D6744_10025 [Planctomycetota bacterium]|nr:MAG: hypothetical protein D6744_10025 [Planctomycetota bacterium]